MMVPEAWVGSDDLDQDIRAFYNYHSTLMEPWDGPAAIAFTDGKTIGAVQDRNGLRPARCVLSEDGLFVMASEAGVISLPPQEIKWKGRLQPGRMIAVDTVNGKLLMDKDIKKQLAARQPYADWVKSHRHHISDLPKASRFHATEEGTILKRQLAFGWTEEDIRAIVRPMAETGKEPVGSMGADTPPACLSEKPQPLFSYFRQLFAQVTNPPIDPIREELVMSLNSTVGRARNILSETPEHCHTLSLSQPILTNEELEKLRRVSTEDLLSTTLNATFVVEEGESGLRRAIRHLCRRAELAVKNGYTCLILSSRGLDEEYAPIPSLMATAAVHNHLIRVGLRSQTALIVESGEPREVMHFALLIGYGASAVNPYLAMETIESLAHSGRLGEIEKEIAVQYYIKACGKGLLKIFSKMGISTMESYKGAQVFEAVGLDRGFVEEFLEGTPSRLAGIGADVIAAEALEKHAAAMDDEERLPSGGDYSHRVKGEQHLLTPSTISSLQHHAQHNKLGSYEAFSLHLPWPDGV
jgi:hypothetical protein